MLRFKVKNFKPLKTCVGATSALVEEATFVVTSEGLKLRAMDPSHVALVDLDMPAEAFESFEVEKPAAIGVDLTEMSKIMSRANSSCSLSVQFDGSTNRLTLTFDGPPKRCFSMPVIDVQEEGLPKPEIRFPVAAKLSAGIFQEGIRDAGLIDDTVEIGATENGIRMLSESDRGSSELDLDTNSDSLPELSVCPRTVGSKEVREERSKYSVKYLADMIKACSPGDVIGIKFGTDLPIQIDCPIARGRLQFLLAPRVEARQ